MYSAIIFKQLITSLKKKNKIKTIKKIIIFVITRYTDTNFLFSINFKVVSHIIKILQRCDSSARL